MTNATNLQIGYGRRSFPEDVRAVWGARLIWPNDLVYDRQDLDATDDTAKAELIRWLNGADDSGKDGAIARMRRNLADANWRAENGVWPDMKFEEDALIYEDDEGKIIGSAQRSGGYLYVCGWLKGHTAAD